MNHEVRSDQEEEPRHCLISKKLLSVQKIYILDHKKGLMTGEAFGCKHQKHPFSGTD